MGLPLLHGSPPRRGESEPPPGGRLPTFRFSSCGQEHGVHYHHVHLICPQAVRCWMPGFRFCATPLGTSHWGTLCIRINVVLFFSGTPLRARTFIRNVRWGGHNSTVGVTLPEAWARFVQCIARGKLFELFWPWAYLRQIPGFPQYPRGWCFRIPSSIGFPNPSVD